MVDEVWAATEFIADAFRAVTDKPVHVVHVPVPETVTSPTRSRAELGLPDGRFVFLVTLDHLSITDRKNPLGAIHAFERAFPAASTDGGPVLFVKTLNGRQRWSEHEQLQLAAAGSPRHHGDRSDTLSRADQMALICHSDCLVSLHRSEGLGLHLMEAMWLDIPVIATRYSGNLEFMNEAQLCPGRFRADRGDRSSGLLPDRSGVGRPRSRRRCFGDAANGRRGAAQGRLGGRPVDEP